MAGDEPHTHFPVKSKDAGPQDAPPGFISIAEVEDVVRSLTENLERRIRVRTNELREANERLLCEIDERSAIEDRLRESKDLYRYTIELGKLLVWTAAPDGTILSVGRRMVDVTGLSGVSPNEGWLAIVHPEDRGSVFAAWKQALEARRTGSAEFRMRVADGSYRTFRAFAEPQLDRHGKILRWFGYNKDIHDQKLAEVARIQAEELYRLAARATNDAIWDLDVAANTVNWSDTASETLGYPGAKLGTTGLAWWEERVHPDDRKKVVDSFSDALKRKKTRWAATYRFLKEDGDHAIFYDRGFVVTNSSGDPVRVVGAMADLTSRYRAEEEVRRVQAELIHVSRLSAMGTMASTLAHELNQPLTAVTNYVRGARKLIDGTGPELAQAREALESAENGALRAGQIVRRLRELVARGSSASRPEDLPKLIADAAVLAFVDAHVMGVSHRMEFDPGAQWVEVDNIQIQQVMINLIRNAMQAMQGCDRREIVITTKKISSQWIEVSIADSGVGISLAVRDAVFSPFQGTKADGMGIGLSISRTIVEAHGGKISADDRPGGGAIFQFTLPAYDQSDANG